MTKIDQSILEKVYLIGGRKLRLHPEVTAEAVISGGAVKFNTADTTVTNVVAVRGDAVPTEIRRVASEALSSQKVSQFDQFKTTIRDAYCRDETGQGQYTESARSFIESNFNGRYSVHRVSSDDQGITVHSRRQLDAHVVESIRQMAGGIPVSYAVSAAPVISESVDAFIESVDVNEVLDEQTVDSIVSEAAYVVAMRLVEMAKNSGISSEEVSMMRGSTYLSKASAELTRRILRG